MEEVAIGLRPIGHVVNDVHQLGGVRWEGIESRVVVLMSDGETNEGSVWEAATFAAANRLHRLLAIVDHNGVQSVGRTGPLTGFAPIEEKFRAFGWAVRTIDGHDMAAIRSTLTTSISPACRWTAASVSGSMAN